MNRDFPLARDHSATALRVLIWASALLLLSAGWLPAAKPTPWPLAVLFSLMALLLIGVMVAAPRSLRYTLTSDELRIRHFGGVTAFPVQGLRIRRAKGHLGLKVGGVGFPGYYTGNYQWKGEGRGAVQALASTTREGVLVEFGAKSYFLTPAEVSGFLTELERRGAVTNR